MSPQVVSTADWLAARKELIARESEFLALRSQVTAARSRLPMVPVEREYLFEGAEGKAALPDLFEGRRQLITYFFMFDPEWDQGCKHCSFIADNIGHLAHAHAKDTTIALVSRAPYSKIAPFKERMGWSVPWYSVVGNGFNHDFHVTLDDAVNPPADPAAELPEDRIYEGEAAVFLREGDGIFHTYSSYGEVVDLFHGTFNWLDLTSLGRRDDEPGRPWLRHHDRYPAGI
jgi:predicted dithiol-disulfide oxidoreductase (DUF899 family)